MSETLLQFHFLHPWCLLGLILLPLLMWAGLRSGTAQLELSRLVDPELLPHMFRGRAVSRYAPVGLIALGWILGTLAFAGPTWSRVAQPLYANRAAQVVAISLSQHMLARDVAPDRLDRARYKARDLLADNPDGLNGLIGYAGEAFVVAPLTSDAGSLDDLLQAMAPDTMPVDGNDAASAIRLGVQLIHNARVADGSLVLITDQADAAADAEARKAKAAGVHVSVLGVGTPQGGPVPLAGGGFLHDADGHMDLAGRDDAAFSALASAGGGRYAPMTSDRSDIDALHAQLRAAPAAAVSGQTGDEWQDRGPWLLLPLLLVVALAFRRGWLLVLPLVLLPLWPGRVDAASWSGLWQRSDQQAAQAMRQGSTKPAQQFMHDPAWQGAAAYRAGNYAQAAQILQRVPGSNAVYNRGNALARQGDYPQAISAYDRALKLDPANADAAANRKAVEDWMRRQQQKQQQKKQQKQQDKQGQSGQQKQQKNGGGKGQPSSSGKPDGGSSGKAESRQAQNGKPAQDQAKPSSTPDQPAPASADNQTSKADQGNQDRSVPPATGSQTADQFNSLTPQQQAAQKAQTAQAQQALQKQMDQALAKRQKGAKPAAPPTHELGAMAQDDPESKLPADLRQALQRVPDDPGALLRRKFQLEYQQRHGGAPNEDQPP